MSGSDPFASGLTVAALLDCSDPTTELSRQFDHLLLPLLPSTAPAYTQEVSMPHLAPNTAVPARLPALPCPADAFSCSCHPQLAGHTCRSPYCPAGITVQITCKSRLSSYCFIGDGWQADQCALQQSPWSVPSATDLLPCHVTMALLTLPSCACSAYRLAMPPNPFSASFCCGPHEL